MRETGIKQVLNVNVLLKLAREKKLKAFALELELLKHAFATHMHYSTRKNVQATK